MRTSIAAFLFTISLSSAQQKQEDLKIVWPEEYKWKVASNQEDKETHLLELIPAGQTVANWKIMGTMMAIKNARDVKMDDAMNLTFNQARKNSPKATLTFIEKDEKAKNPWIIFKIEAPGFLDDPTPESQLFYVIQGESALYSNFIAVKRTRLSGEFTAEWTSVFKKSELVYDQDH